MIAVKIIGSHNGLFSAVPLPEPMIIYLLDPKTQSKKNNQNATVFVQVNVFEYVVCKRWQFCSGLNALNGFITSLPHIEYDCMPWNDGSLRTAYNVAGYIVRGPQGPVISWHTVIFNVTVGVTITETS